MKAASKWQRFLPISFFAASYFFILHCSVWKVCRHLVKLVLSQEKMRPVSVFVGGLNDDIQKEDLEREFSRFGTLNKVWVARNPPGFAFIEFDDEGDANEAIKEMNGASINGSEIRVDMSRNDGRGRGGRRGGRRGGGGFRGGRDGGFRGGRGGGGGYDSGYSSYGGRGGSRYGGGGDYSRSSYGGGDDYRSSGYRSRSPVGHRNGSGW